MRKEYGKVLRQYFSKKMKEKQSPCIYGPARELSASPFPTH